MFKTKLYCILFVITCSHSFAAEITNHQHLSQRCDKSPAPFVASSSQSFSILMDSAMKIMDCGMTQAQMTGNPDHDFAAMMIPHHQGAIDMAKIELLYGKDPVLRRLAQEIIVTQNAEIELMKLQLKKRYNSVQ